MAGVRLRVSRRGKWVLWAAHGGWAVLPFVAGFRDGIAIFRGRWRRGGAGRAVETAPGGLAATTSACADGGDGGGGTPACPDRRPSEVRARKAGEVHCRFCRFFIARSRSSEGTRGIGLAAGIAVFAAFRERPSVGRGRCGRNGRNPRSSAMGVCRADAVRPTVGRARGADGMSPFLPHFVMWR